MNYMTHIDFKDYIDDLKSAPYGEVRDIKKERSICDKDYYLAISCSYKCAEKEIISGSIGCCLDKDCIGH